MILAIGSFIIGLAIGSFINCFVWRLHKKETMLGRSYCPKCGKAIAWYDNIPLLSFLFLKGRCRHCHQKISWQYLIVEVATGLLFVLAWYLQKDTLGFVFLWENYLMLIRSWFLISVMIIIFIYDFKWYLILDVITLPAMAIIVVVNLMLGYNFLDLLLAGGIGGGFFLIQFLISRGKWIGGGDIRMGVLMGLSLGNIWHLIVALFLTYIIGSLVGIILILTNKKKWGSQIPLGIFLAVATIITLFWGVDLINWYKGLLMI